MFSRRSDSSPALGRSPAVSILLISSLILSCGTFAERSNTIIAFDLSRLDENGLQGPPDGKRAIHYEFCIPAQQNLIEEVTRIDTTLEIFTDAKGRIGCGSNEYLCLGHTHQPGYASVLARLAALSYVHRIEESFFEH